MTPNKNTVTLNNSSNDTDCLAISQFISANQLLLFVETDLIVSIVNSQYTFYLLLGFFATYQDLFQI